MYIGNTVQNQGFTPQVDFFSGNASTTAFTLSRPVASVYQMVVVVANVIQNPGSAYTVSSNTIIFSSAPPTGTNNIWVEYTSLITQVIAPSPGTVGTSQLQSNLTLGGTTTASTITSAASTNLSLQTNNGTTALTLDTSQNAGFGVTPSGWTGGPATQFKYGGSVWNNSDSSFHISENAYFNGSWNYISGTSASATNYFQSIGTHNWRYASAGTGALTWTTGMILDASGNWILGGTTARTRITLQVGEANAPTLGTASGGAFFGNSNVAYGTLFGTSGSGYGWIQQQRVDGTATAYDLCLQPSGGNLLVGRSSSLGTGNVPNLEVGTGMWHAMSNAATVNNAGTLAVFSGSNRFCGFLTVVSIYSANATQRTQTTYSAFIVDGDNTSIQQINTATGTGGGSAFTLAWTNGTGFVVTNTSGAQRTLYISATGTFQG